MSDWPGQRGVALNRTGTSRRIQLVAMQQEGVANSVHVSFIGSIRGIVQHFKGSVFEEAFGFLSTGAFSRLGLGLGLGLVGVPVG